MKIFPWDFDEKPYWINPENGLHWFIDKDTTRWCTISVLSDWPPLEAVAFIVAEKKDEKFNPITRILLDKKTNDVLHEDKVLEGMAAKIDILRLALHYDKQEKQNETQ